MVSQLVIHAFYSFLMPGLIKTTVKMKKVLLIQFLIAIFCFHFFAQENNRPDSIAYENMLEDFRYYIDMLESTHIDPYTPIGGKLNFKIKAAEFEQNIPKVSLAVSDFSLMLSGFSSQLNDNHTYFNLNSSTGLGETDKQMPFYCKPASDGIFVNAVKEDYKDLFGAKIIAVNNRTIEWLLEQISILSPCENISNAKSGLAWALVNYSTSARLFPGLDGPLDFTFVNSELDTIRRKVEWIRKEQLNEMPWHLMPCNINLENRKGIFNYQFVDEKQNIMYFCLKEMFAQEVVQMIKANNANHGDWTANMLNYYPDLKSKYSVEEGLKQIPYFTELFRNMLTEMRKKNSEYLILDLTSNSGGYSDLATSALYLLFGDKCFSPDLEGKYVRRISQLYLDKYNVSLEQFNTNNGTDFRLGDYDVSAFSDKTEAGNQDDICYKNRLGYFHDLQKNNFGWGKFIDDLEGNPYYTPQIVVLTSTTTNSAAYHFLYRLSRLGNITVIGVAPKQAGNTPMEGTPFSLPNSKIKGSVSNAYQLLFLGDDEKAKIFIPDFPLSWKDYQERGFSKFTELEIAIELIISGKI